MVATAPATRRRLLIAGLGVAMATAACSSGGGGPEAAGSASGPTAAATSGPAAGATAGPTAGPAAPTGTAALPPRTTAPTDGNQRSVLNNLPGDAAAGTCVAVGTRTDVRSGTMAAGNFVTARKAFADQVKTKEQPSVPLYLIPGNAKGVTSVTVKLRSTRDGSTRTVKSDDHDLAEDWVYFPVHINIPAKGTWEITATAGTNTGCFSVTFG